MKKKRFYNNKKRNTKWTEKQKGRKIDFADKYIESGNGSDKFDSRRPRKKKKLFSRENFAAFFRGLVIAICCFAIVSVGYTIMDLYVERHAMPVEDDSNQVEASFADMELRMSCMNIDSLSLDGGVMLQAVLDNATANGYSAVSFDIKRDDGTIGYESKLATIEAYGAVSSAAVNLRQSAKLLKENDILPVARISCYKDNIAPIADLSSAVISSKSVFRDNDGNSYLNPSGAGTYNYLKSIIEEVKGMGINVFVLDNVTLPEEAGIDKQGFEQLKKRLYIDFGSDVKFMQAQHIDLSSTGDSKLEAVLKDNLKLENDTVYYITTSNEAAVRNYFDAQGISDYSITVVEKSEIYDEYDDYDEDYDEDDDEYNGDDDADDGYNGNDDADY